MSVNERPETWRGWLALARRNTPKRELSPAPARQAYQKPLEPEKRIVPAMENIIDAEHTVA